MLTPPIHRGRLACMDFLKVVKQTRAATSLARLGRQQGKTPEARDLLALVDSWFTEEFDTADSKNAKALLDELT